MPLLYGSGKIPTHPAWVTSRETPSQRDKRFRDINDAIEKQRKRDEERKNRELFKRLERQGELRLSPPEPPKPADTPTTFLDDIVPTNLGTQNRFEIFLDRRLEGYEAIFGMAPLFGSQRYATLENLALEDWREEQSHVPDDRVAEREGQFELPYGPLGPKGAAAAPGLIGRSRELREGVERPLPDVDSKYDIMRDSIVADLAADWTKWGIPIEGEAKQDVSEDEALRYANDAVDEWLKERHEELGKALDRDPDDQTVRELVYRQLRTQEHLSDVLDEWALPRDAKGEPRYVPQGAIDEAVQREEEENGALLAGFPAGPGPLEALAGIAPGPLGPIVGGLAVPFDPVLEKIESVFDEKWIPTLDPSQGFKPTLATLDDVHRGGQFCADPAAHYALKGIAQPVRAGELAFGEVTGVETTAVSGALQSQLAEDILSEVISPEYIAIALPFAGVGVRGLTGLAKLTRITANLTIGTDIGLARGFPLLRASSARAVLRGLTAVGRAPLALRNVPRAVRNNPVFQRGLYNLRAIRAERVGRGLPHDEWLKAIGAADDAKFRRVVKAAVAGKPSAADDLPLRMAVDRELTTGGRSAEGIIEHGLSPRVERAIGPRGGEGEIAAFWRGEGGGGELRFLSQREALSEQRVFDDLVRHEIIGGQRGITYQGLQRVVRNADLVDPDLLRFANEDELIQLLQARRVIAAVQGTTLKKLRKSQLLDIIDEAALPISKESPVAKIRADIQEAANQIKTVRESLVTRSFESLTADDVTSLFLHAAKVGGEGPTQLVGGKLAQQLRAHRVGGLDPALSTAERVAHRDKYLARLERLAEEAPDTPLGAVQRASATRDANIYRWEWEVRFGEKAQAVAQGEVADGLTFLTARHRGTPEERLKKLSLERSKEITDGVDDFLFQFHGQLDPNDLAAAKRRLTTLMLDVEDGVEILDAGRQLEALFRIAKVGQGAKNKAYNALRVLTEHGTTPKPEQVETLRKILEPVLGVGTTRALLNARTWGVGGKGGELVLNTIGLPRALMASSDISAVCRQGSMLGARYPKEWAQMAGRAVRAFFSPGYADSVRDSIIHGGAIRLNDGQIVNMYDLQRATGGFLASDAGQKGLRFREEFFMTGWSAKLGWHLPRDVAGKITLKPWAMEKRWFPIPLAQTERSYVMPLDRLRRDFFDNTVRSLVKRGAAGGTPIRMEHIEQLSLFINNATGRGSLWKLENLGPILNALFFAPRLVVSRFAVTADLIRYTVKGGPMRRVIWETLAADVATASGALFLIDVSLKEAGVEGGVNFLKPIEKGSDDVWRVRSDWMKIRVGETYIDFMASMGPTQRLLLKLGVAAYQGDWEMAAEAGERFLESKEAPVPSGLSEVITGTDYAGGKVEMSLEDLLGDVVASRVIPLSWQSPFEAVAAARGEIDIDIGPAMMDVLSDNKLNKDEVIAAGASLSAEMIGGGVVSYFQPGEKLREKDDENLQVLLARGEIPLVEGQEAGDVSGMDDLNKVQARIVYEARGLEEKELEEKQLEQGLWRDSEWAKHKDEEEKFHESVALKGGYFHPETGEWEKIQDWPQADLDRRLRLHLIDGGDWNYETAKNEDAKRVARNALFGHEEEDIEDIENPVDKLIAEYWNIELKMLPGGDLDWETLETEQAAKKAEIAKMVGDPVETAEYFESFRKDDTQTQKDARVAKEQRNTLMDDLPMYMAGVSDVTIDKLLDRTEEYLLSVGSRWSVGRYIQWLYYQGEEYQTNEWAIAYWVAIKERDMVINPERTRMVLANEDLVLFYPGLFRGLTDEGKQAFVNRYGIGPLSKGLQEDFIDTGELTTQQPEAELFQPQPLFQR